MARRVTLDIVQACIDPFGDHAHVLDEHRAAVIDVLDGSWMGWDQITRRAACDMLSSVGLGGLVDEEIRSLLAKATNDQLSCALWAVWSTGCLLARSATRH